MSSPSASPFESPHVVIFTTITEPVGRLDRLAHEVSAQSLRTWTWIWLVPAHVSEGDCRWLAARASLDERIHLVVCTAEAGPDQMRASRMRQHDATWVMELDIGETIDATQLERWTWYLETRPAENEVRGDVTQFGLAGGAVRAGGASVLRRAPARPGQSLSTVARDQSVDGDKRLLFVVPWFAMGGSDKFNLDVIDQLTRRGWRVTVVSTRSSADEWLSEYSARTPDVFPLHRFVKLDDVPRFLSHLITSRQISTVLISHSELGYRLAPRLRYWHPTVAFVDYLHVVEPAWYDGGYPRFSLEHRSTLDRTVTSSADLQAWMLEHGTPSADLAVCYTNVDSTHREMDSKRRAADRTQRGASTDSVVVLFVGRLCDQKQPRVLLDALARCVETTPSVIAWIVGDGPDRAWVEAEVGRRGLQDRVVLRGALSPSAVAHEMALADVLFLPSKYEGIALVLFEALASALPIVASDVGGQRELVTPDCGVLLSYPDEHRAERYAEVLAELASMPERRRAMGQAGRERVRAHFRLDDMGERLDRLLHDAAAHRAAVVSSEPGPSHAAALATATAALRLAARYEATAHLWTGGRGKTIGERAYIRINRALSPLYEFALRRRWGWVQSLGRRIRWLLIRAE